MSGLRSRRGQQGDPPEGDLFFGRAPLVQGSPSTYDDKGTPGRPVYGTGLHNGYIRSGPAAGGLTPGMPTPRSTSKPPTSSFMYGKPANALFSPVAGSAANVLDTPLSARSDHYANSFMNSSSKMQGYGEDSVFKSMGSAAKQRGLHSSLLDGGMDNSHVMDSSSYAPATARTPRAMAAFGGALGGGGGGDSSAEGTRAGSAYDSLDARYHSWVCVTGFPIADEGTINVILIKFQQYDMETYSKGAGNWLFIKLSTPRQAANALSLDGAFLSDAAVLTVRKLDRHLADKLCFQPLPEDSSNAAAAGISRSGRQAQQFRQHLRPGDVSGYLQSPDGGFSYLKKNRGSQLSICALLCSVLVAVLMFELKAFYSMPTASGFVVEGVHARSAIEMLQFGPSQSKFVYSTRYNPHSTPTHPQGGGAKHQGKAPVGLKVNFNITLYTLPCEAASVESADAYGGVVDVRKWPVDAKGIKRHYPDYKSDNPVGERSEFPGCLLAGSVQYSESSYSNLVSGGAVRVVSALGLDLNGRPAALGHVINSLSFGGSLGAAAMERVRALPRGFVSSPLEVASRAYPKGGVEHQVTAVSTTVETGRFKGHSAIRVYQLEHSSAAAKESGQLRVAYSLSPLEIGIEQSSKPYGDVLGGAVISAGGALCILLLIGAVVNHLFKPKFFDLFNLSY